MPSRGKRQSQRKAETQPKTQSKAQPSKTQRPRQRRNKTKGKKSKTGVKASASDSDSDPGHHPVSETEELSAICKRTRRGVQHDEDSRGLFKVIHRRDLAFRLLDLPPEIRLQIYRFAIGYRTLHVRWTDEIDRPYQARYIPRIHRWKYFVCKCGGATHPTRSEYAVGAIWAGDGGDGDGDNGPAWRRAIPVCGFCDSEHCDAKASGGNILRQKLDGIGLLRVNKQVHAEAHEMLYSTNIFAFVRKAAFHDFLTPGTVSSSRLFESQLRLLRNICIYIQPVSREMGEWNDWIKSVPDALDNLRGLRKLQIVVGYDFAEGIGDWAELWRVHWVLSFARLRVPEVNVDISLCHWRTESERREGEEHARFLERKLHTPWDDLEEELRELREVYLERRYWGSSTWR
ncbi:hypothetical protein BJY00DRAFT_308900 [Aspergillus carlsbadensis]|nr:hypothetical protein BJY00DRAFT_308900 [Aspergillus carlsbadensis]